MNPWNNTKRHIHDADCTVPLTEIIKPRTGTHAEPVYDEDGICRYDIWEAEVGCKVLRIPIFYKGVRL